MRRSALIGAVLAVFVLPALISADSASINFEPPAYSPGSIQGQNGWGGQNPPGIPINPAIDQEIVTNGVGAPASFGKQSWRLSNFYTAGSFGDMPFSPSLVNEAGETQAQNGNGVFTFSGGVRQSHFEVQFAFASLDPNSVVENDSYFSASPDRGDGARMSYIRIEDHVSGIQVFFDDYQDRGPQGSLAVPTAGCTYPQDDFIETMVASGLDRSKPHTVKLAIDFIDGPHNDVVKVYIDGTLRHTGTTWEDYFRWCTESGGGVPFDASADQSRTVDSMLFRVGGGGLRPQNQGRGFLIDNLTYFSSQGRCRGGDGDGDFEDDKGGRRHHGKFHHDSCENDRGRVEEDDRDSGKHFESTSTHSATFTSNENSQTLTMIGTGLHDGLPVAFTMVAVDNGNLAPGVFTLILTDGYSVTGSLVNGRIVIE